MQTGFAELKMIFDKEMISTFRLSPHKPTAGDTLYRNPEIVKRESNF
jgi:hypothetical protein